MCKIDENKSKEDFDASVDKVVDTIMNELGTSEKDEELLGDVIIGVVRRRLGDISVDAVGVCRSAGEQELLVENCARSFIEGIKDYIDKK